MIPSINAQSNPHLGGSRRNDCDWREKPDRHAMCTNRSHGRNSLEFRVGNSLRSQSIRVSLLMKRLKKVIRRLKSQVAGAAFVEYALFQRLARDAAGELGQKARLPGWLQRLPVDLHAQTAAKAPLRNQDSRHKPQPPNSRCLSLAREHWLPPRIEFHHHAIVARCDAW